MTRLEAMRSVITVAACCAVVFIAGLAFGASHCTANAKPLPKSAAPSSRFQLDDPATGKPMYWRTADGRDWCAAPVTSLVWTVCP